MAALLMAGALALGVSALVAPTSGAVPAAKGKPTTSTKTTKQTTKKTTTKKTKTKRTKTKKTKTATTTTRTTTTTASTTTTTPPALPRNPYLGTEQYVNVDWSQQVDAIAAPISSVLHFALEDAADQPTAVWVNRIAELPTLAHHLDAAVAQSQAHGKPVVVTVVLNDRPANQCEPRYGQSDDWGYDVATYRNQFIAPVAALLSRPEYSSLRFAVVLEPGSIAELQRYATTSTYCQTTVVAQTTVPALQAALDGLAGVRGAAVYLDGAGSATNGWSDLITRTASLYETIVQGTSRGVAGVAGFAVNVGDYAPWQEPFFTATTPVGTSLVRASTFYQWTSAVDEETYVGLLRGLMKQRGWPENLGVLVDTSRNGWGGPNRPTSRSTSTDVNTFVNASRFDRRPSRMDWCNQTGAGMGARPQATPATGVDAFVWVHNPGISDGAAPKVPSEEGKGFVSECDPGYVGDLTEWKASGAMEGAPAEGQMFLQALAQLATNASPPLRGFGTPTSTAPTRTSTTTSSSNPGEPSCTTRPPTTSTSAR